MNTEPSVPEPPELIVAREPGKTEPSVPEPPELIVAREKHAAAARELHNFDERLRQLESDRVRLTSVRQKAVDALYAEQAKVDAAIAAGRLHVPKLSTSDISATLERVDQQLAEIKRVVATPPVYSRAMLERLRTDARSYLELRQHAYDNACAVADAPDLVSQLKAVASQIKPVWGTIPEFHAGVLVSRESDTNIVIFKVVIP